MKIRSDFVTNSSSTAFVLISRSKLTKEGIRELIGIAAGSPLAPIADSLYERLSDAGEIIRNANNRELQSADFAADVMQRVTNALAAGHDVRVGNLHSDEGEMESFLCCDSFEAENDAFYLNALRCVW